MPLILNNTKSCIEQLSKAHPDFLKGVTLIQEALLRLANIMNWGKNLCGACAIGSYLVFKYAEKLGLDATFVLSECHCYTILRCKKHDYIVDVTATQFSSVKLQQHLFYNNIFITEKSSLLDYNFADYYLNDYTQYIKTEKSIFKSLGRWEEQSPQYFIDHADPQLILDLHNALGVDILNNNQQNCA